MKIYISLQDQNGFKTFSLKPDGVNLGRSQKCDISISDTLVSGTHLKIIWERGRVRFSDIDSKNGVFLNGTKVKSGTFFIGDEIKIGTTLLKIAEEKLDIETKEKLKNPNPNKITGGIRIEIENADTLRKNRKVQKNQSTKTDINFARDSKLYGGQKHINKKVKNESEQEEEVDKLVIKAGRIDMLIQVFLFIGPLIYLQLSQPKVISHVINTNDINDPNLRPFLILSIGGTALFTLWNKKKYRWNNW